MTKPIVLTKEERKELFYAACGLREDAMVQDSLGRERYAVRLRNSAKTLENLLARAGEQEVHND